jgi:uncharacterized membrane protein YdfJ with MMPL/SSD domain
VSPRRPSGRRFAALVAALCVAATAVGAFALPRLAADGVPASLKPAKTQSLIEQKREDGRCGRERQVEERELDLQAPT